MHISVLYPHGYGYCIHTAEDIVKLLSQPDSPISLIFEPRRRYQFQGEWAQKQGVGGTFFCTFRLKSPFIFDIIRDRPTFAMEH